MRASTTLTRSCRAIIALSKVFTAHASKKTFSTAADSNEAPFDVAHIKSKCFPRITSEKTSILTVPSARFWVDSQLHHFNLHYFQIEKEEEWKTYICPPANLTPEATALSKYALTPNDFARGNHERTPHVQDPIYLKQFGECIAEYMANVGSEAVSDKLAERLLYICNPRRDYFMPISKLMLTTPIGPSSEFTCILDLVLAPRVTEMEEDFKYPILSLEDKYKQVYVEPQLGAGLLATAIHNFQYHNVSTTVFGMTVKGTRVALYRVDFPQDYLFSIIVGDKPKDHVVIFKLSNPKGGGFDVAYCGPQRTLVLQVLSSMISFCEKEIVPHIKTKPHAVVPSATSKRLALLQDWAK